MKICKLLMYSTLALSILWAPGELGAQAITATVVGTVADPTGASVPEATVAITNVDTGQVRTTSTNAAGNYPISVPAHVAAYVLSVGEGWFSKGGGEPLSPERGSDGTP